MMSMFDEHVRRLKDYHDFKDTLKHVENEVTCEVDSIGFTFTIRKNNTVYTMHLSLEEAKIIRGYLNRTLEMDANESNTWHEPFA